MGWQDPMIHAAHMHRPSSNKTATDPSNLGEEFKAEVRAALVRGQDAETNTIIPLLNPNEQADYAEANEILHHRVLGLGKQEGLIEDSQDFKDADEGVRLETGNSQSGKKSKSRRIKKRGQHRSGLESDPEAQQQAEVVIKPDGSGDEGKPHSQRQAEVVVKPDDSHDEDQAQVKPEAEVIVEPDGSIDAPEAKPEAEGLLEDHEHRYSHYEWKLSSSTRQRQHETLDKMLFQDQALINQTLIDEPGLREQHLHRVNALTALMKSVADDAHIPQLDFIGTNSTIPAHSLEEVSSEIFCAVGGVVGTVGKTLWRGATKVGNFIKNKGKGDGKDWLVSGRTPGCICLGGKTLESNALSNTVKATLGAGKVSSNDSEEHKACKCECCAKQISCKANLGKCHWDGEKCEDV